jgi:hypothetical protein
MINLNHKAMTTTSVKRGLPEPRDAWEYRGNLYALNTKASAQFGQNDGHLIPEYIKQKSVLVPVLHPNLRGRTDHHGRKYAPTYWIYTKLGQ